MVEFGGKTAFGASSRPEEPISDRVFSCQQMFRAVDRLESEFAKVSGNFSCSQIALRSREAIFLNVSSICDPEIRTGPAGGGANGSRMPAMGVTHGEVTQTRKLPNKMPWAGIEPDSLDLYKY